MVLNIKDPTEGASASEGERILHPPRHPRAPGLVTRSVPHTIQIDRPLPQTHPQTQTQTQLLDLDPTSHLTHSNGHGNGAEKPLASAQRSPRNSISNHNHTDNHSLNSNPNPHRPQSLSFSQPVDLSLPLPISVSIPAPAPPTIPVATIPTSTTITTLTQTVPPPPTSLEFVDRLMTPPTGFLETRRRGRQATACLECNRRKQKCDRLQPCHHCAKRNLIDGCVYPDKPSSPTPQSQSSPLAMPAKRKGPGSGSGSGSGSSPSPYMVKRERLERREIEIGPGASRHMTGSTTSNSMSTTTEPSPYSSGTGTGTTHWHSHSRSHHSHPHSHATHGSHGSLSSASSGSDSRSGSGDASASASGFSELPDSLPCLTPETYPTPTPLPPLPTSLPPTSRPIGRSIPVSSERHEVVTPPPQWAGPEGERYPQHEHQRRMDVDLDMDMSIDMGNTGGGVPMRRHSESHDRSANGNANVNGGSHEPLPRRASLPRVEDLLMQEGGAAGIGSLAKEGAEEHGDQFQFYGTSHFGPRLAAQVMHGGKPNVDVSDSQYRSSSGDGELLYQIRQLDSALPKRSLCKRFVDAFFDKYNSWVDILYARDFYARHDEFWVTHSEFEDFTRIDLRWFALFHTILAFGSLLDDRAALDLAERQAISNKCFVAARRALSEAPSFYGESLDTVTAYTLLSLYLVAMRRMPESWHMVGSGVRAAQAQGFQVDGETWHLLPKDSELWRRLWAQMYILDRSISYFLGRPLAIQDGSFTTHPPANMHDDELELLPRSDWPLTTTTHSTFLILHYKLAQIIGQILTSCFGLNPRNHAEVMRCEDLMVKWSENLPPAFRLDEPDTSTDDAQPWIRLQRRTLMSKFHQARISLHRPYLLPSGRADYAESRLCCVLSAGVELRHRLSLLATDHDPFDRFKWLTVASGFSPACVLGLLLARAKREVEFNYDAIRSLLVEYITVEKNTLRRDRTLENELAVLDMMLAQAHEVDAQAQRSLRTSKAPTRVPTPTKKRGGGAEREKGANLSLQTQRADMQSKTETPLQNGHSALSAPYPPSTPATLSPTTPVLGGLQSNPPNPSSGADSGPGPGPGGNTGPGPDAAASHPNPNTRPPPHPHQNQNPPPQYPNPYALGAAPAVLPGAMAHPQPRFFERPLYYPLTPPPLSFVTAQGTSTGYNDNTHGHGAIAHPLSPTSSLINPTGALATLAPAPQYDDPRWFTFPSPMDPSADTFPPVHDTEAWVGLLESIGPDWGSVSVNEG